MKQQEELFIDGQKADLKGRITTNIRGGSLSEITAIRDSSTYTINVARTENNDALFGYPDVLGADYSEKVAEKKIDVYSDGFPIIKGGKLHLTSASKDEIKVNVIGRAVELYANIENKSLQDLDFGSDDNFLYGTGEPSYIAYPNIETWNVGTGTSGNVDYNATSPTEGSFNPVKFIIRENQVPPFISKDTLVQKIIEDAGYNWEGGLLLQQDHYARSYVSLQVPVGTSQYVINTSRIQIQDWMHDISQKDFLQSVMYQYGVMLFVSGIYCFPVPIREIQNLKANANDWSSKINLKDGYSVSYDTGYGVTNRFGYKNWDYENLMPSFWSLLSDNSPFDSTSRRTSPYATITSSNKNVPEERDVCELVFRPAMEYRVDNSQGSPRNLVYLPCFDGTTSKFNKVYDIHDVCIPETGVTFKTTGGSAETWSSSSVLNGSTGSDPNGNIKPAFFIGQQQSATHITTENATYGLGFPDKLIDYFWGSKFTSFIREPMVIEADFYLDTKDIKDFLYASFNAGSFINSSVLKKLTPVYVKELDGYFLVSDISQYKSGQSSKVKLIRV